MPFKKLSEIKIDDRIYPRPQKDNDNIRSLVEKLKAGTTLDSIIVQNVMENGDIKCLNLNGAHRLLAYEEYNKLDGAQKITDIEVEHWRGKAPIPFEGSRDEMLIFAHDSNDRQGLNMRTMDTKHTARMLRERHPEWGEEYIGQRLNRGHSTIHEHIKDIIQRQQATEHSLIIRLSRLGWTQQEIADHPDVTVARSAISKIVKNVDTDKIHNLFYESNKEVDKIAEMFDIDEQTAWAILLEGKDAIERLEELTTTREGHPLKIRPWDVWNYSGCDPLFGQQDYVGRIPGQLMINLLYFYTKQGDFIVDPMAGGGTTIDACLIMGRKCLAFDKEPTRPEVRKNNLLTDGFPALKHKCQLIFLDPPYYKKKENEYGTESISALTKDDYLEFFNNLALDCKSNLSSEGRIALLMADFVDTKEYRDSIFGWDYTNAFKKAGLRPMQRIQCPLSSESLEGSEVKGARNSKTIYIISRELIIFEPLLKAGNEYRGAAVYLGHCR